MEYPWVRFSKDGSLLCFDFGFDPDLNPYFVNAVTTMYGPVTKTSDTKDWLSLTWMSSATAPCSTINVYETKPGGFVGVRMDTFSIQTYAWYERCSPD